MNEPTLTWTHRESSTSSSHFLTYWLSGWGRQPWEAWPRGNKFNLLCPVFQACCAVSQSQPVYLLAQLPARTVSAVNRRIQTCQSPQSKWDLDLLYCSWDGWVCWTFQSVDVGPCEFCRPFTTYWFSMHVLGYAEQDRLRNCLSDGGRISHCTDNELQPFYF